ncbi:PAS domain-containing protein [Sphingomonas qilianensis]|uniref:histidine kinase n=1 Tax=Sphingomonas qilianensis TaxID=1736690 RepID=A0ABU9XNT1_9SPHN
MADGPPFLSGGGALGLMMRTHDWAATPLGPPEAWPQSLRSVVGLMLTSRFPMFMAWGEDLAFLYNDSYVEILGSKHPAALGRPFREVWSEIWRDIEPLVSAALSGNPTYHENLPLTLRRRGFDEQAWFTFSYSPVRDDDGDIAGMFCACTETTVQVLAEERRVREIDRQRRLFAQAPGFITVLGQPNHVFEFVNDSYVRLFGERQYIGRNVREVFPELEGQGFFEWLDQAYTTGERYVANNVSVRLRPSDSEPETERYLDFIYEPVIDEDGTVTGIFCEGHDVTEAWTARKALEENEARLRNLNATLEQRVADALAERRILAQVVETTDVYVQVVDMDLRWLAINKASADEFERIFGVRPHAGDSMLELLAGQPDHCVAVERVWGRALRGEAYSAIDRFGSAEEAQRYYEMKFSPLLGAAGEQVGAYQFVTDVTARLVRDAELAQAQEALRQSQKMDAIGQLTGGVAHDFNNLLTPIIGSMDLLQRKGIGDERTQRMIDGALQSAERAKTLVQRLLAFARRQPLQPQPVDVGSLVKGMDDLLSSTMGPRTEIVLDVPPGLPAAVADANQVEMALLNLAVNARDAMPDGGTLAIAVAAEQIGANDPESPPRRVLRIRVRDTGVGMDEATRLRATEPFFSTKGVGQGTGLGLSMVHGLAAQLGGSLVIESAPGAGTTIEIRLPLAT